MGAQGKGLQVQNHNGEWIDAIAEPDELMINVGDMLFKTYQQQIEIYHSQSGKPTKRNVEYFKIFNSFLYASYQCNVFKCP